MTNTIKCWDGISNPPEIPGIYYASNRHINDLNIGETHEIKGGIDEGGCTGSMFTSNPDILIRGLKEFGLRLYEDEIKWEPGGELCDACDDRNGCECYGGQKVPGKRGILRRIAFNGDKLKCCKKDGIVPYGNKNRVVYNTFDGKEQQCTNDSRGWCDKGDRTCDPRTQDLTNTYCDSEMLHWCGGKARQLGEKDGVPQWDTPQCKDWVINGLLAADVPRNIANNDLSAWCSIGTNFTKDICQEWCQKIRSNSTKFGNMNTDCDKASLTYCKNNPSDERCKCANAPLSVAETEKKFSHRTCWYSPCFHNVENFIPYNWTQEQCVGVDCSIDVNASTETSQDISNKYVNNCGLNMAQSNTTTNSSNLSNNTIESESSTSNNNIYIIIGVVIAIIMLMFVVCSVIGIIAYKNIN